jgi:hypothetical protein
MVFDEEDDSPSKAHQNKLSQQAVNSHLRPRQSHTRCRFTTVKEQSLQDGKLSQIPITLTHKAETAGRIADRESSQKIVG